MSLINQMLKDLEQRRSSSLEAPDGPLYDLSWSASPPVRIDWRTPLLWIGGVAVLASVAAWLAISKPVISKQIETSDARPIEIKQVTAVEPVAEKKPEVAPVAEKTVVTRKTVAVVAPTSTKSEPASKASSTSSRLEADAEPAAVEGKIQKQARPLTSKQRAAVAYQRGYDFLRHRQYANAEAELRQALRSEPRHLKAREMLAGSYVRTGRLVEAGELLREGLGFAPRHSVFAKLYARILTEQDAVPTAIHILEQSKPRMAADPEYHALIAALHQRQRNHAEAARIYNGLVKLRSNVGLWWIGLGVSLEALGNTNEAMLAYQHARERTGLSRELQNYTDSRLAALKDIGYPNE